MLMSGMFDIAHGGSKELTYAILTALGAIALFLFGLKFLSQGLRSLADTRLRTAIAKVDNAYSGLLIGLIFTLLIQSSDGTIIIALSLLTVRMIKLETAIGIALGANIGTTVTAFMISLSITKMSGAFVLAGLIGYLASKPNTSWKHAMQTLLGFGITFFGLLIMEDSIKSIVVGKQAFSDGLKSVKNPFAGLGMGMGLTVMMQSSSASTGLIQTLYAQHTLDWHSVPAMIFGANIGTTVTIIIASIGASRSAKRLALIHTFMNTTIALVAIPLVPIIGKMMFNSSLDTKLQLALIHLMFNVTLVVVFVGFIKYLARFAQWAIKPQIVHFDLEMNLDAKLITSSPALAVANARQSISKYNKLVAKAFDKTQAFMMNPQEKLTKEIDEMHAHSKIIKDSLYSYIAKLIAADTNTHLTKELMRLTFIINDYHRAITLSVESCELLARGMSKGHELNDQHKAELREMLDIINDMVRDSRAVIRYYNKKMIKKVDALENELDNLVIKYTEQHFEAINSGGVPTDWEMEYIALIKLQERTGDHIYNSSKYFRKAIVIDELNSPVINKNIKEMVK